MAASPKISSTKPLFTERAEATFAKAVETFHQRGRQYGDTWRNCRFLVMKAVAREMGCVIPERVYRALAAGAFIDMKHERFEGGFRDDNLTDGINYGAFLHAEMEALASECGNCGSHDMRKFPSGRRWCRTCGRLP